MTDRIEILVDDAKAVGRIRRAVASAEGVSVRTGDVAPARHAFIVTQPSYLCSAERWARMRSLWIHARRRTRAASMVVLLEHPTAVTWGSLECVTAFAAWFAKSTRVAETFIARDDATLRRLVLARTADAHDKLIASADLDGETLVVWSCEPRRYVVPIAAVRTLADLASGQRRQFRVSASGSRIHWDAGDIDLNLDAIRAIADPSVRKSQERQHRQEASRYAKAIRKLREERGLSQGAIAGLSERQVRRLEHGDHVPHSDSLAKLAAAHEMTVSEYLGELAARSAPSRRPRGLTRTRRRAR